MSENNQVITIAVTAVVGGIVALGFVGFIRNSENSADFLCQLPAFVSRLEEVLDEMDELDERINDVVVRQARGER